MNSMACIVSALKTYYHICFFCQKICNLSFPRLPTALNYNAKLDISSNPFNMKAAILAADLNQNTYIPIRANILSICRK